MSGWINFWGRGKKDKKIPYSDFKCDQWQISSSGGEASIVSPDCPEPCVVCVACCHSHTCFAAWSQMQFSQQPQTSQRKPNFPQTWSAARLESRNVCPQLHRLFDSALFWWHIVPNSEIPPFKSSFFLLPLLSESCGNQRRGARSV